MLVLRRTKSFKIDVSQVPSYQGKEKWKNPQDDEGAYERAMKKKSIPVKAVTSRPVEVESFELGETYVANDQRSNSTKISKETTDGDSQ